MRMQEHGSSSKVESSIARTEVKLIQYSDIVSLIVSYVGSDGLLLPNARRTSVTYQSPRRTCIELIQCLVWGLLCGNCYDGLHLSQKAARIPLLMPWGPLVCTTHRDCAMFPCLSGLSFKMRGAILTALFSKQHLLELQGVHSFTKQDPRQCIAYLKRLQSSMECRHLNRRLTATCSLT